MDLSGLFSSSNRVPSSWNSAPKPKPSEEPSLDDIDLGLGELHSYDLRSLSKPSRKTEYEDNNGGGEGGREENEVDDSVEDSSDDSDYHQSDEEADEEGDVMSLTDSGEMSWQDIDSDGDGTENADLEDEVPRLIDTSGHDDNGNPIENVWTKIYLNGNMWARNSNGTISISVGDMFVDKGHWSKVIRDYAIQKGIALQRVKNDRSRHIATCRGELCTWRVHQNCPRLIVHKIATHPWIAEQMLADYKANPSLKAVNIQKLVIERHGLSVADHTCTRALRLLRSWVDGKHEESYARLPEYIEEIKERNPGTVASCIAHLKIPPLSKDYLFHFLS